MAPVQVEPEVRYIPLAIAASHAVAVAYLTSIIAVGLYRSYRELGPSQETRLRILWRAKLLPAFGGLAVVSFLAASYSSLTYATVSYQTWADERGIEVPNSLFGNLWRRRHQTTAPVYLARWLSDTPIYVDAYEIVAEKARRFWWGQQLDLATVSWSMLLAVEGRRRHIPFLWAYVLLSQAVNLSFAQNLFYVALLLAPSPIARAPGSRLSRVLSGAFPPKPENWSPHPAIFFGLLLLNYTAIFQLPYVAGTATFTTVVILSKLLPFTPIIVPAIVPEGWGTVHEDPHDAYDGYGTLFQFASLVSALLFGKSAVNAVFYSLPDSYKHRHSIRIPFDTEERSQWERTTSAFAKVLGSTSDHPVVAAVGRDVLLSALSLGLWASVRAIDVENMLRSGVPFYEIATAASQVEILGATDERDTAFKEESAEPATATNPRRRTRLARAPIKDIKEEYAAQSYRRQGKTRKIKSDPEEELGDGTYEPSPEEKASIVEGDVLPDEDSLDWESASLAWGLTALGGLGAGSAAVFGAECTSR